MPYREALQTALEHPGLTALGRFPTSAAADGKPGVRAMDLFGNPASTLKLPLNRKTTASARAMLPLDSLEPTQEFTPVAGLASYVVRPRRDPPDVAHVVMRDGRERFIVQEGHTRLGAAKLRGESEYDCRQWEFTENASGQCEPVPRGLHARGMAKALYRDKLERLLGDVPGHPFRGNQWGDVEGGGPSTDGGSIPDHAWTENKVTITDKAGKSYRVEHVPGGHIYRVHATNTKPPVLSWQPKVGEEVEIGTLRMREGNKSVDTVEIVEGYQRQGIGSALYDVIERNVGHKLEPDTNRSPKAKAFWEKRQKLSYRDRLALLLGDAPGHPFRGNQWSEGGGTTDAASVRLYRAHGEGPLAHARGSYTAIGRGAYFGLDPKDVEGYAREGRSVREFAATGKLLKVQGEKELRVHRDAANAKAAEKLKTTDYTNPAAREEAVKWIDPSSALTEHLKSQGYDGIHYVKVDPVNDHHSQVVIFDPSTVAEKHG